jgi:hypothetical protein
MLHLRLSVLHEEMSHGINRIEEYKAGFPFLLVHQLYGRGLDTHGIAHTFFQGDNPVVAFSDLFMAWNELLQQGLWEVLVMQSGGSDTFVQCNGMYRQGRQGCRFGSYFLKSLVQEVGDYRSAYGFGGM